MTRAYRAERYLFSTHRFPPCFLTFVRPVHSNTFGGGLGAPRFFASEWLTCIQLDRVMSPRDVTANSHGGCGARERKIGRAVLEERSMEMSPWGQ